MEDKLLEQYMDKPPIAYHAFYHIVIYDVIDMYSNDYVISAYYNFTKDCHDWFSKNRVKYNKTGEPYFVRDNELFYLKDFIKFI